MCKVSNMNDLVAWCVEVLLDTLSGMYSDLARGYEIFSNSSNDVYGSDLAYELTFSENDSGDVWTPTDFDAWAFFQRDAFKKLVVPMCKELGTDVPNPLTDGWSHCCVMLYLFAAEILLHDTKFFMDHSNGEFTMTKELIIELMKELYSRPDWNNLEFKESYSWNIKFNAWLKHHTAKDCA